MDLLIPSTGLLFWMSLTFLVVLFILWKFGFPVITNMVAERKAFIDDSLRKAHEANEKLVIDIFKQLHKEGRTVIVVTHAPEVAVFAQRTIVLEHGKFAREIKNGQDGTQRPR